ncbi:MAG: DEAD/DEAH box helicase, partial [Candidatus Aenigmarchaeota archaeon]|nr:DEAD/DEAH box helicase [Candidatus Aenigmarchaeota archaeon]
MHDCVRAAMQANGIESLNPAQQLAVDAGLVGNSMVVATPTASGKTLLAEIAILQALAERRKALYIVPLRALAREKYDEFRQKYPDWKLAISIGDFDSADTWLDAYEVLVMTSEKLDSIMRHGAAWLEQVGLVVADEVHLLDDLGRGPTMEIVLTKLRMVANPKVLALSATIRNYEELADWLAAKRVKSDYRPVKLEKGVCHAGRVTFEKHSIDLDKDRPHLSELVEMTLQMGKQALIFISTRKGAEASAEKLAHVVGNHGKSGSNDALAAEALQALDTPTKQCEKLAKCLKQGIAFHHAGLADQQRKLIEDGFRAGKIKVVCATPTLAAGLNLPAYRVIIRDLKRFYAIKGMDYLSVLEVQQMMGRAGRPKYDTEGQAILIAKNDAEATHAMERYVHGEPEDVISKLGVERVLRIHILGLIASGLTDSRDKLFGFFARTFYAHHHGDLSRINGRIEEEIDFLAQAGFIDGQTSDGFATAASRKVAGKQLKATKLGKRVSELYIDPETAKKFLDKLEQTGGKSRDVMLAHLLTFALEARPLLSLRKKDIETVEDFVFSNHRDLVGPFLEPYDSDYEESMRSFKTALMLLKWVDEWKEDRLLDEFGVAPGELRARLDIADWLLYALQEIALLAGKLDVIRDVKKLRIRLRYGIREELLPLVRLKGVGRARARALFSAGLRSLADLRSVPHDSLARLVGTKTAESIKAQLGEP